MTDGSQNAKLSGTLGGNQPEKREKPNPQKLHWYPTLSLKFGLMHLWMGNDLSDGRRIFLLLEEIPNWSFEFKFHWLTDETPMFALCFTPLPYAHLFWLHSHDILKTQ
jgi:hypothetical protein